MTLARQIDLDKIADDAKLDHFAQIAALVHGQDRIRSSLGLAAGNVVLVPDALGHLRKGKGLQAAAHVSPLVAIGKAANEERIERRARDHAKLTEF